jgi:hypothetical protein
MRLRNVVASSLAVLICVACSAIPDSGPLTVVEPSAEPTVASPGRLDPAPPKPGSSPRQLVRDFIYAMQAYPVSTDVAREYLSNDAVDSWNPWLTTVIYESAEFGEDLDATVEMQVVERARLDAQGTYSPRIAGQQRAAVQWRLLLEDGEWRIANPPDALYVEATYFEDYYSSYNLYFLEPFEEVAVGEPVYFPTGDQLATNLVRALLAGPSPSTSEHLRTALPSTGRLEVAIPVELNGVAEVRLTVPEEQLSKHQAELMSVQLVSTLRQVPGVLGVRIVVNEVPLDVGRLTDVQDATDWEYYVPAHNVVERRLFALEARRLVTIEGAFVAPVDTPLGRQPQDLDWVLVKESTEQLLGVSRDGRRLITGPVGSSSGELAPIAVRGTDFGRPTHDRGGAVAVVDRTSVGSRLVVVENVDTAAAARVPLGPLSPLHVDAFTLSPDGVRFVAVASPKAADGAPARLFTGWVTRNRDGQISGVSEVRPLTVSGQQFVDVRDAGWTGENTVALIGRFAGSPHEIYTVDIDGSDLSGGQVSGEPLPEQLDPVWLATAGLEDAPVYAAALDGTLWLRDDDGQWRALAGAKRLRSATFAG